VVQYKLAGGSAWWGGIFQKLLLSASPMVQPKNIFIPFLLALSLFSFAPGVVADREGPSSDIIAGRFATFKFDDLRPRDGERAVTAIEQAVYEKLQAAGIPHAWGVYRLGESDNPLFYQWLRERHAEGVEIWHHGNHHDRILGESWEFKNRSRESQLDNLLFTQNKIFEKTGIVLRTFGAPYNQTDEGTGWALNQIEALEILYFGRGSPNFKGLMLNDRVNLEASTGVVATLEAFKASYARKESAQIIVLQGHPALWQGERDLPKLAEIIGFLQEEGRVFITPSDFLELTNR
jgi:peptidoglycan/xylan/chitin deacetylase (PgdA/CDA1 family)